ALRGGGVAGPDAGRPPPRRPGVPRHRQPDLRPRGAASRPGPPAGFGAGRRGPPPADRVPPAPGPGPPPRPGRDPPPAPPRSLGPALLRADTLPPRLHGSAPPQAGGRPGAAPLPPDGTRRGLSPRRRVTGSGFHSVHFESPRPRGRPGDMD